MNYVPISCFSGVANFVCLQYTPTYTIISKFMYLYSYYQRINIPILELSGFALMSPY